MGEHFWQTLPRPLLGLAPMDGITDHPCRHIQKKYGRPALIYTEFVAVERLATGDWALLKDFLYDESQRPIIAQVYGHIPELFPRMVVMLCELGFDGIDINMGCPATSIVHRGSGAGLIRTPDIAQAIIHAARQGVHDWLNGATMRDLPGAPPHLVAQVEERHRLLPLASQARRPIPISVKTRIGYDAPQVREWIPRLLDSAPDAIALHGRTLHQRYGGNADWEQIGVAAELARGSGVLMLGNGDVRSYEDAMQRVADYGLDGVLIGRGGNGNPFVFQPDSLHERLEADRYLMLRIALEHAQLHSAMIGQGHPGRFLPMRKHLGWYVRGVPGASSLRRSLVETSNAAQVAAILDAYFAQRRIWEEQHPYRADAHPAPAPQHAPFA